MNFLQRFILRRTLRKAASMEERGRFEDACSLYETALELVRDRERVGPLSRLGRCYLRLERPADARKPFEEARNLAPDDATVLLNYGRACQELGDSIGADESYQKANELAPNRPDILYRLADFYTEKYTRAGLEAAKRAATVTLEFLEKPGGPQELQSLGFAPELPLVLIRNLGLGRADADQAAGMLREFADRPTSPTTEWAKPAALLHLGLLLVNTGKYAEAEKAYREALAVDSSVHPVHFNLAMALARMQKMDEAEKELKLYAERAKGSPVVAYGYGTIAEYRGESEESIRHYRGALQRLEVSPVSPAVLGRLDVPRNWVEKAKGYIAAVTGEPGTDDDPNQWVGPGR